MKIIKFKDETYGIRKISFLSMEYEFKDLISGHWWNTGDCFFASCKGTLKEVKKIWEEMKDTGETL